MLASTSRTILRSRNLPVAGPSRNSFSTSTNCSIERRVLVELLEDVPNLGSAYDRIFVAAGKQRHQLGPTRAARLVPWKKGSERLTVRTRLQDGSGPTTRPLIPGPGQTTSHQNKATDLTEEAITPQELLNTLHLLPSPLTFPLRTISPTSTTLHGSLTLSDIQEKLANEFGLGGTIVEVSWIDREAGARIKELASWGARIQLRDGGREIAEVEIEVVRA